MRKSAHTVNITPEQEAAAVGKARSPPEGKRKMRYAVIILAEPESEKEAIDFKKARQRIRKRQKYFIMQKMIGTLLLAVTALSIWVLKDATAALITMPLGLYLIFTRKMMITNQFYYEEKERENEILLERQKNGKRNT